MSDICMVYDERGNAFDGFPFEPEELEYRARLLRGYVTLVGPPWFVLSTSAEIVQAAEDGEARKR